jgi:3-oxoadipate enol-lactonase
MDRISGDNLNITAHGLLVNYDDNGPRSAPPVVFVHSTPFHKGIWDLQAESLKSNYRVITYDLRGHGNTAAGGSAPWSIGMFADDLIALLDALEIETAILCGVSLGSHIVLNAAERYPGRFNALVLAGAQCAADSPEVKQERESLLRLLDSGGMEKYVEEAMKRWFAPNSFTARKEEVRAVRRIALGTPVQSVKRTLAALSERKDNCGNLTSIRCPVLILTGCEDQVATVDSAGFMRENIPGSEMHLIEYAGHLANLENTHEFNTLVRRFIDKVCERQNLSRHCEEHVKPAAGKALAGNSG